MPAAARTTPIGHYLKNLRSDNGLTLRQVQELSSTFPEPVAYDYLSRVETGRVVPSIHKLITLSSIYGVPAQRFLDLIELQQIEQGAPSVRSPQECRRLGEEAFGRGDLRSAYGYFKRGLALLDVESGKLSVEGSELRSRLQNNVGVALIKLGKFHLAQPYIEQAFENRTASEQLISMALINLASIAYQMDRLRLGETLALGALRAARRSDDRKLLGSCTTILSNIRADLGKVESAAGLIRRSLELHSDSPDSTEAVIARLNLGACLVDLDRLDEAEAAFRQGVESALRNGDPRLRARGLMDLGRFLYTQGHLDQARPALLESREVAEDRGYRSESFHSTYYLWRMALEQKNGPEAVEFFRSLKRLRMMLDQRSEEALSFDGYLEKIRLRRGTRRRK